MLFFSRFGKRITALAVITCAVAVALIAQATADPAAEAIDLFNQGQDRHAAGDLVKALEFYNRAIKLIGEFPEAELQCGHAYVGLRRLDEAEQAFRRAVQQREDWSLAHAQLGSLLVRRGKLAEADKVLSKAIELDADNIPAYAALTRLKLKLNAPAPELHTLYKKIAAMTTYANPAASIWAARASLENAFEETRAAKASAGKALELDSRDISMLALLGSIALEENDIATAENAFLRIEKIEPAAPEAVLLRAHVLLKRGRADDALKVIDAAGSSPELTRLREEIVTATTVDVATLQKMLDADPRNVAALGRLCSSLRTKEPARAIDFCRRANELEPTNIEHAIGYGGALLYLKQFLHAAAVFERIAKLAPDNATVRANLATALFNLKRYTDAKAEFRWLTERQPDLAAAYFFLAVSHDELREYGDAMANYQRFLKYADPELHRLEIDKVNLRMPILKRQLDKNKGRTVRSKN